MPTIKLAAGRDRAVASLLWLLVFFFAAAVFAAASDMRATLLILQWAAPLPFALYGILLTPRHVQAIRRLTTGLSLGVALTMILLLTAAAGDVQNIANTGRIDPIDPPLPGMYQVGSYTPEGIILAGLLLIALSSVFTTLWKRRIVILGVAAILSSVVLLGSREGVLIGAFVGILAFYYHINRRQRKGLLLGLGVAAVFLAFYFLSSPISGTGRIASFERATSTISSFISSRGAFDSSGVPRHFDSRQRILQTHGLEVIASESGLTGELVGVDTHGPTFPRESAHNVYLELLVDFGLFGFFVLLVIAIQWIARPVSTIRRAAKYGLPAVVPNQLFLSVLILSVLLISANVRLPLAQPYPAFLFYLSLGLFFGSFMKSGSVPRARPRRSAHARAKTSFPRTATNYL